MLTWTLKGSRLAIMKRLVTFLLLVALPSVGVCYVYGGTNFGFSGYPDHNCSEPYKPFTFSSDFQRQRFILEVEAYKSCISEYVENSTNDIKRIQEKASQSIDEYNSFIRTL